MLELWKPILFLKDKNNPVIFDEFTFRYSETQEKMLNYETKKDINKAIENNHPFIIFYDSVDHSYYYIKARGKHRFNKFKNKLETRKIRKGEIEIEQDYNMGLFKKNVYVDCSQIFKIDADLLESLVDIECKEYKDTSPIRYFDKRNILDKINECCNTVPPYLSIIEVYSENNIIKANSLYLCEEKIDDFLNSLENEGKELSFEGEGIILESYSNKDSRFKQNKERYWNGIKFCNLFLKQFYQKIDLDNFLKNQNISNDEYKKYVLNDNKSFEKERDI